MFSIIFSGRFKILFKKETDFGILVEWVYINFFIGMKE